MPVRRPRMVRRPSTGAAAPCRVRDAPGSVRAVRWSTGFRRDVASVRACAGSPLAVPVAAHAPARRACPHTRAHAHPHACANHPTP